LFICFKTHNNKKDWDPFVKIAELIDEIREIAILRRSWEIYYTAQDVPRGVHISYTSNANGTRPPLNDAAIEYVKNSIHSGLPQSAYARGIVKNQIEPNISKVHNISRIAWAFRFNFAGIVVSKQEHLQRAHLFGVPGYGKCVLAAADTTKFWKVQASDSDSKEIPFDLTTCLASSSSVSLERFERKLKSLSQLESASLDAKWRKPVAVLARDVVEEW
jgi:hypothetical protein|tara:strand:- start:4362 stop:5015 length:654 start_codon:yes stop_codon:yes gene_type:complete